MSIVINPKYEHLRDWITRIPEFFANEGEVIYNARNQIRLITTPDGTEICVKRYHRPSLFNRFVYTYLRTPKAVRAYQNAILLKDKGIGTPEPIAYMIIKENGLVAESYLVCQRSLLARNFYEFRHHSLEGYEPIVQAFAQFTAKMHEQGILHLDYSPGNILFDIDANGQIQFEVVDINRMQFNRAPIAQDTACHNFCRLWGKEDFFRLLAKEYAQARNFDIDQCTNLIIRYWKRFWRFRK